MSLNETTQKGAHSAQRPVAIVTGGSRGIGRGVVEALAREGWNIAFSYVANAAAAAEVEAVARNAGANVLAVRADMASPADIGVLFAETAKTFGRLDALVNNAGVVGGQHSILDADEVHLREVFEVNVVASFLCAREAARVMSTQRGGRGGVIVNLSSAAARHGGLPMEAHYAASKGAIDSFTVALAKELPPHGIRVNTIRPGLIRTDIHEAHGGLEAVDRLAPSVPLGRAGTAAEVADVVAFLCSPRSAYVHGAIIDVSGGR